MQSVDRSVFARRLVVLLVAGFAGFGLLLASLGIYAVIAYSVAQRTQEIGMTARAIQSLLYEVSAADPGTFGAVVMTLTAVAAVAGYLPARRATRVDPAIALRAR